MAIVLATEVISVKEKEDGAHVVLDNDLFPSVDNDGNNPRSVTPVQIVANEKARALAAETINTTDINNIETKTDLITITQPVNLDNDVVLNSDTSTEAMLFVIDEDSFSSNLATKVPTQQSAKTYIDTEILAALSTDLIYKGGYDAAANIPDLDSTPIATAIGDFYVVTVAGTFFTASVEIDDRIISEVVNATVEADWTIVSSDAATDSVNRAVFSEEPHGKFDNWRMEHDGLLWSLGVTDGQEPITYQPLLDLGLINWKHEPIGVTLRGITPIYFGGVNLLNKYAKQMYYVYSSDGVTWGTHTSMFSSNTAEGTALTAMTEEAVTFEQIDTNVRLYTVTGKIIQTDAVTVFWGTIGGDTTNGAYAIAGVFITYGDSLVAMPEISAARNTIDEAAILGETRSATAALPLNDFMFNSGTTGIYDNWDLSERVLAADTYLSAGDSSPITDPTLLALGLKEWFFIAQSTTWASANNEIWVNKYLGSKFQDGKYAKVVYYAYASDGIFGTHTLMSSSAGENISGAQQLITAISSTFTTIAKNVRRYELIGQFTASSIQSLRCGQKLGGLVAVTGDFALAGIGMAVADTLAEIQATNIVLQEVTLTESLEDTVNTNEDTLDAGVSYTDTVVNDGSTTINKSLTVYSKDTEGTVVTGWAASYNKEVGESFNVIGMQEIRRPADTPLNQRWNTIELKVRTGDINSAIVADAVIHVGNGLDRLTDLKFILKDPVTGLDKTVLDTELATTYTIQHISFTKDGRGATTGKAIGYNPTFAGSVLTTLNSNVFVTPTFANDLAYDTYLMTNPVYEKKYITHETVEKDQSDTYANEFSLPPFMYCVEDKELSIYFDNIVANKGEDYIWDTDDISPFGIGRQQNERFFYDGQSTSQSPDFTKVINFSMSDRLTLQEVATESITVEIAETLDGTGLTKICLFIGDSTTAAGVYTGELLTLMSADVLSVTLIGTKGSGLNLHEGINSQTVDFFHNSVSSPFVFLGVFNFSTYMSTHAYASVDIVSFQLGINDMLSNTIVDEDDAHDLSASIVAKYKDMITSIHAFSASTIVGIGLTILPNGNQDAFTVHEKSYALYKRHIYILNKYVVSELSGITNVKIIPYNINLDVIHNMQTETVAANSRTTETVVRQTDSVHPATSGYYQMADTAHAFIKNNV